MVRLFGALLPVIFGTMLVTLLSIATNLGVSFSFGDRGAFNVEVDAVATFPLMYVEGYAEGYMEVDGMGVTHETFTLSVWLFGQQRFEAHPTERMAQINALKLIGKHVVKKLSIKHDVSRVQFMAVVNVPISDRKLDGVRLQFTVKPVVQELVC